MSDEIILDNLAHLPLWVGWREVQRNGRATKVPFDPRTGEEAKSTDPTTWATRGEAETWAAFTNHGGVGIVLSQFNGGDCCLCGIDLDTCRDPTTEIFQDWAQEVIDRFKTYTEVSPSGTGAKLFFIHASADLPAIEKLFEGKGGRQFKNGGGEHCPAIEIYRTARYFTVTDESIGPTDILRQVSLADLEWLIIDAGPKFAQKESQKNGSGNDQSRSGKAFRKGATLKAAGYSYAAMRDALLADEDPEIAEWARTKGLANGERELHRIYDNAKASLSPDFIRGDEKQILRGHPDNIRMAIEHFGSLSVRHITFCHPWICSRTF
jgi:putative DNA primase/helicase